MLKPSAALSFTTQNAMSVAEFYENEERNVLKLGSLCLPCCVWGTA